jgi:Flp pilus assembly protein TadD
LQLDPKLTSSLYQLARVYQREGQYAKALTEIDAAGKLSPNNSSVHYVRGQILQKMGRTAEARKEMQTVAQMDNTARSKREKELENQPIPNPEVQSEPQ